MSLKRPRPSSGQERTATLKPCARHLKCQARHPLSQTLVDPFQ